jgi:Sensory domain found in PocR
VTTRADDGLFGSALWQASLETYASATQLTVVLFDADERPVLGPVHLTPLFQLFEEAGYSPAIFTECARRCIAQTDKRPAVLLSEFHGLAVVGTSLVLDGRVVGAAVGGYALSAFCQTSEVLRLARQAGIGFERLWAIERKQPPVSRQRLIEHGELLQVLGDALLRENHRTRQYEQAVERLAADLAAMQRLQETSTRLIAGESSDALFGEIVTAAIAVVRADRGSLHSFDEATNELRVLTAEGFQSGFLDQFDRVTAET